METKYKTSKSKLYDFKHIMEEDLKLTGEKFLYVQSGDRYYIKEGDDFLRYRSGEGADTRKEITFKKKWVERNNICRQEVNLRVDPSDEKTIDTFITGLGYNYSFCVYKYCHIYFADDAVLVFYTVKGDDGKLDSFMEIEVNEEMEFTEDQGWEIIRKYEKVLEPLGIKAQNRIRRSLFEMYRPKEQV